MKSIKKACLFIGMVVGAGFASGREITDYFLVYGSKWTIGILFSGVLFFIYSTAVTSIINKNKINSFHDYLNLIMDTKFAFFTEWVSGLFFCMMFFAMVSAAGSAAREIFGINFWLGVFLMIAACAAVLALGINAIENISVIIVPLLVIGIALIGAKSGTVTLNENTKTSVIMSSIIYVSYNTMTAASVIAEENKGTSRYDGIIMGLLCGVAMTFMGYFIGKTILYFGSVTINSELPFAAAAKKIGGIYNIAYAMVFITAVYTTAVCDGMAAIRCISDKLRISSKKSLILLIILAVMFSFVSFTDFVSKIYPVFGVAGILQLIYTIKFFIKPE
ncbi:MAG: hypothetical protein VB048_09735 [Bacteroidaceae bacterium]|nr:hypothetical protein [Bacteroidaceae bacterium]